MPNTHSAERRMRSSARKHDRNRSAKSQLLSLEKRFRAQVQAGDKEKAAQSLKQVVAALDKAAKKNAIHPARASRKKSRLTLHLNRAK